MYMRSTNVTECVMRKQGIVTSSTVKDPQEQYFYNRVGRVINTDTMREGISDHKVNIIHFKTSTNKYDKLLVYVSDYFVLV